LALLAWIAPARANIGDTLADLREHYGSAATLLGQAMFEVKLKDGQIVPVKDSNDPDLHFSVTVYFDDKKCSAMEIFTPNTSDPVKSNITPDQISTILAALGDGQQWASMRTASGKSVWLRSDKKVIAKFNPSKGTSPDDAAVLVVQVNQ